MARFSPAKLAVLASFVATIFAIPPTWGAEFSTGNSLGFSRDGNHFVFEEYGVTDGLGAPYVSLYAIDIVRDKWLKGTPVSLQSSEEEVFALEQKLADEGVSDPFDVELRTQQVVNALRAKAIKQANPVLDNLGRLLPADMLVHNPSRELTSDAREVRFSVPIYRNLINSPPEIKAWSLKLTESSFPANNNCFTLHETMVGFTLTLINEQTGEEFVLNNDQRVPGSRGCPQKYFIEQVLAFPRKDNAYSVAVLVRYATPGFEGPDGRLIAVTAIVDR